MRAIGITYLTAIIVLIASVALVGGRVASAQEAEATLTIHKTECYTGVGSDIFEDCHDQGVGDVAFVVNGGIFVADATGVLALEGEAGTVEITEDPEVFGAYLGAYVYCRDLVDDEVLYDGSATDSEGTVVLDVQVGDEIVCDWYNITEAPTEESEVGGATTLPATGTGPSSAESGVVPLLMALAGVVGVGLMRRRRWLSS